MECKYLRIQGREDSWVTKYPKGIFGMCWRMILDGGMEPEDEKTFREIDKWFREHLPEPEPCKNGPAVRILDRYGHPYDIVSTNAVGTIIYEDEWQIAVRVDGGKMI